MAITKLDHVGIMVTDLEKSLRFYEQVIGLIVTNRRPRTAPKLELVFLSHPSYPETAIELIAGTGASFVDDGRVHHLAFTVDDLDAECKRLDTHGVRWIHAEPNVLPDGSRYRFFYGPDREQLELFEPAKW